MQSIFMLAAWFFSATQCTFPHLVPWLYVIYSLTRSSQLACIRYGVTLKIFLVIKISLCISGVEVIPMLGEGAGNITFKAIFPQFRLNVIMHPT